MPHNYPHEERRQYIRLDSVFPVQFRVATPDEKEYLSGWLQGFTNNIGRGGICLDINHLQADLAKILNDRPARILLEIKIPVLKYPVPALAHVVWIKNVNSESGSYLLGLDYDQVNERQNSIIMRYARAKQLFAPAVFAIVLILGLGFIFSGFLSMHLGRNNRILIEQLNQTNREASIVKQKLKDITAEREKLESKIKGLKFELADLKNQKSAVPQGTDIRIRQLAQEKIRLEGEVSTLKNKEAGFVKQVSGLDKKKALLEQDNLDKMYHWLTVHQNPHTGLVLSFEGDSNIKDWAFIYDQSLVAQAYIYQGDFARAKKILDFFTNKAQRQSGWFINAYYINDSGPAEYTVHSGPNIWVGIAALHYVYKTQDPQYLGLAQDIAANIMNLQNKDAEGGIQGGPDTNWYSTEHNLDAYAFFGMLYKITAKEEYLRAREKVLAWLAKHTYNKSGPPIKRAKGDSTIATDTYAWSIAAIGPDKLDQIKMNPDKIMEFAEEYCGVEVPYKHPSGKTVLIRGFDFAPQQNLARGGVVSSEWTAQMIISLRIMADFYYRKGILDKASLYQNKANDYMASLWNMIICSPSPSGQGENCLPYATQQSADTGHGWITPQGDSTGSLSGTAYTLFAQYNYNPLELK